MVNNDGLAEILQKNLESHMASVLKDRPDLIKALIPTTFPAGCLRLTPGPSYLESLTDTIQRIVPEGIQLESGETIPLDAIICATGFDVAFCPRFPIFGQNGVNLQDI
jgi:hypothetical protein